MKKIIESELISIAHRILKLKDRSDIDALYNESKNLFEKISVLKFYEENKFRMNHSITDDCIVSVLFEQYAEKEIESISQEKPELDEPEMSLDLINDLIEESENSEIVSFDQFIEAIESEAEKVDTTELFIEDIVQDVIEDEIKIDEYVAGDQMKQSTIYPESESEVVNHVEKPTNVSVIEVNSLYTLPVEDIIFQPITDLDQNSTQPVLSETPQQPNLDNQHLVGTLKEGNEAFHHIPLNKTINDAFSQVITVGLNDRIAFEKNLFNGSSNDLNRVISQLNTIETFQEAQDFIDDLVKPDFNYWKGKEEYEERFMELIKKRF